MLAMHADKNQSAAELAAASRQCAPGFVIPGAQKGASTFLFHALMRHPQVIPPLRGAHGYKEAGAYLFRQCQEPLLTLGDRMRRFPFIEPSVDIAPRKKRASGSLRAVV